MSTLQAEQNLRDFLAQRRFSVDIIYSVEVVLAELTVLRDENALLKKTVELAEDFIVPASMYAAYTRRKKELG